MARYEYRARDSQDRTLTGTLAAADESDALGKLEERHLIPLGIEELNFDGSRRNQPLAEKLQESWDRHRHGVSYREVVFFTRQLATMLAGGVPLARALEQLARSATPGFKRIVLHITEDIGLGNTFSDAIARHKGAFNNMYVAVVHSGEVTGALNEVLDELATYMENVEAMKSRVRAAMRYPLFIGAFVALLVTGMLWFLVPRFESIYASFGAALPLPTQILTGASRFMRDHVLWMLLMIIGSVVAVRVGMTDERFRYQMHRMMLRIPVFGGIVLKNIWALYCRTMALLMDSGTPILQATEIAAAVVSNKVFSKSLEHVYADLRQGELLSSSLERTGRFPVLVTQLVATGEESGRVDELLRKAADFYEREIRNIVDSLAAIIEPFLIIILGGIVGLILIALYFPIFMIGQLIKRG